MARSFHQCVLKAEIEELENTEESSALFRCLHVFFLILLPNIQRNLSVGHVCWSEALASDWLSNSALTPADGQK